MKSLKRLFVKKDWRFVKKVVAPYRIYNDITNTTIKDKCKLYYYLFENQFGDRKFDLADSEKGDIRVSDLKDNDFAFRSEAYLETVKPWLEGGYDPEIPNYHSVEHKDLLDTLRGRKSE